MATATVNETDKPAMGEEADTTNPTAPEKTPDQLRAELEEFKAEKKRMADALAKANDQAKKHRLDKEELQRAEDERNRQKLTEEERTRKAVEDQAREAREVKDQLARLRDENLQLRIDGMVKDEARKLNFDYPELIPNHIRRDALVIEDDGAITGVKAAVERLAKEYPNLLSAPRGGGSAYAIPARRPGGSVPPVEVNPEAELRSRVRYSG